jgi:hypothetical protein
MTESTQAEPDEVQPSSGGKDPAASAESTGSGIAIPRAQSSPAHRWGEPVVLATIFAALATILAACLAAAGSSYVSWLLQRSNLRDTTAAVRSAGQYTAALYVTFVNQAEEGLRSDLQHKRQIQAGIVLQLLNAPSTDAVAILTGGAPARTLSDLTAFAGQMRITYGGFSTNSRHPLRPKDVARICRTFRFGNQVLLDLRGIPHVGVTTSYVARLPKGCG